MSKKRDPVLTVLKYFQEAELPLAQQALTLAGQVVRGRLPAAKAKPAAVRPPVRKLATATSGE